MEDPAAGRIEALRRKIQDDPASKLFLQLAEAYRLNGDLEEALDTCRKGLETHPCYHSARVSLGRLFLELGRPEEAKKELEDVLKAVPDNLLASRLLDEIRTGTAEPAAAPEAVPDPAGDREPDPPVAAEVTAPRATGEEASPALNGAANPEPMSDTEREPFETETLAEIYLQQGHRDQAVRIFERILESQPQNTRIRDRLATLRGEVPPAAETGTEREGTETARRKIAVLRGWLDRIHKR